MSLKLNGSKLCTKEMNQSMLGRTEGTKWEQSGEGRGGGLFFPFLNCSQQQWYYYAFEDSRVLEEGMMSSFKAWDPQSYSSQEDVLNMCLLLQLLQWTGKFSLISWAQEQCSSLTGCFSFWFLTSDLGVRSEFQILWHNHSFSHWSSKCDFLGSLKREVVFLGYWGLLSFWASKSLWNSTFLHLWQ